ncbi:Mariner Mos1 transposase [Eumeta japonica]|uniref:Mariner Mos1 transposase n=1 Tax=Eumeta variegata TaxID=151549 RepID=A0A4C1TS22_EUMVA|nr:Mariner Mos1 transposase [Eumeta japonica]
MMGISWPCLTAKPNIHGSKVMLSIWWDQLSIVYYELLKLTETITVVKIYLETLKWEVLPHPPYSPDAVPSDCHLFRLMAHGLADQHFRSYEEVKNWIDS